VKKKVGKEMTKKKKKVEKRKQKLMREESEFCLGPSILLCLCDLFFKMGLLEAKNSNKRLGGLLHWSQS